MQFIKNLLWIARALLVKGLLTFLAKRVLHFNEEVVILDLSLGDHLLISLSFFHERHVLLQVVLLFDAYLFLLALVILRLKVSLFILLPEVHLIRELLVLQLHRQQVLLDLLDNLLCVLTWMALI